MMNQKTQREVSHLTTEGRSINPAMTEGNDLETWIKLPEISQPENADYLEIMRDLSDLVPEHKSLTIPPLIT